MVLDEPTDADKVFEVNGFKFIADTEFLNAAQPVKIDYKGMGFSITSNMELGGGGCGSSCGSGSCG